MKAKEKSFAYMRVSSKIQNVDRQIDALKQYVEDERDIFIDKSSGRNFERDMYQALKWQIRAGDTIYVKSLDRFGRNKREIKNELEFFKEKGVIVRILNIPTTMMDFSQFGKLQKAIMEMVNNILVEVLGTFAETELDSIKARQKEGIAAAKKKGKKFGRRPIPYPDNWQEVYMLWLQKKITAVEAQKRTNLTRSTFYRLVKQHKAK